MDSEDDMHDANDIESVDDDEGFYSDENEMPVDYNSNDDDDDADGDDYVMEEDEDGINMIEARRPEVCPKLQSLKVATFLLIILNCEINDVSLEERTNNHGGAHLN